MDAHQRAIKFKKLHKQGMASVTSIGKPHQTGSNGHDMQAPITLGHLPDALPTKQRWREIFRSWWHRLERQWEPITVNKHIDSVTMPKWIASAILVSMLAFSATSWWKMSDQRDMLIELKTEIRIQKEFDAERAKEFKAQAELNKVYIDNMTNQLNVIKGMLTAAQLSAVENSKRGNN